jgi:hypothetical protein
MVMRAVKESSDAFPPLKSVVGGIVHIAELCETVKANTADCRYIVELLLGVVRDLAKNPDQGTALESRMEILRQQVERIAVTVESIAKRGRTAAVLHAAEDKQAIAEARARLQEAVASFNLCAHLDVASNLSDVAGGVRLTAAQMEGLAEKIDELHAALKKHHAQGLQIELRVGANAWIVLSIGQRTVVLFSWGAMQGRSTKREISLA